MSHFSRQYVDLTRKVLSVVAIIIGLVIMGYGFWRILKIIESKKWPTVTGEIISCNIKEYSVDGDIGYELLIKYNYTLDGKILTGGRVNWSSSITDLSKATAIELAQNYKIRTKVEVYYDPNDFSNSVLKPNLSFVQFNEPLAGLLFILFGFYFFSRTPI